MVQGRHEVFQIGGVLSACLFGFLGRFRDLRWNAPVVIVSKTSPCSIKQSKWCRFSFTVLLDLSVATSSRVTNCQDRSDERAA